MTNILEILKEMKWQTIEIFEKMITEDRYKNEIILEFVTKMFDVEKSFIKKRADEIRLKTSSFPVVKTLEEFDFSFQPSVNRNTIEMLKTMDFVDKHRNLVLLGTPGVGKTHIAIALGIIATQSKRSTYFIDALTLITKLKEAQNHNRLDEQLKQYAKYKLLVIDELGYLPIDVAGANLLFRLINLKYEKSSIIITTNKNFNEWGTMFGDQMVANATVDRLLHRGIVMAITGRSYRTQNINTNTNTTDELLPNKSFTNIKT